MGNVFEQLGGWAILLIGSLLMIGWVTWLLVSARRVATGERSDLAAFASRDRSIGALGRLSYFLGLMLLSVLFAGGAWQLVAAGLITAIALWGLERWWPHPGGTVRTARVYRRTWPEVVTGSGKWLTGLAVAAMVGSMIWAAALGAADGAAVAGALFLVVAGVVALGITDVLRRPAVAGLDEACDALLRRAAADRMLRVVDVTAAFMAVLFFDYVRLAAAATDRVAGVTAGGWPTQLPSAAALLLFVALISIGRVRMPSSRRARAVAADRR